MPHAISLLLAFAAGCLIPLQHSANAMLRKHLNHPVHAAAVNFCVGLAVLLLASFFLARAWKAPLAASAPWWAWVGGLCGAAFVLSAVLTAQKVGPLTFLIAALAGQVLVAAIIDHFGLLANATRLITPTRALGIALIFVGVVLVQRKV
ncbi:MAG: DMT family transporter [Phycisphaeraceae bacterium]|nr:DMT family transporter [Phycisphaeraceae bacterium]